MASPRSSGFASDCSGEPSSPSTETQIDAGGKDFDPIPTTIISHAEAKARLAEAEAQQAAYLDEEIPVETDEEGLRHRNPDRR